LQILVFLSLTYSK